MNEKDDDQTIGISEKRTYFFARTSDVLGGVALASVLVSSQIDTSGPRLMLVALALVCGVVGFAVGALGLVVSFLSKMSSNAWLATVGIFMSAVGAVGALITLVSD